MKAKTLFLWIILFMGTAYFSLVQAEARDEGCADLDNELRQAHVFFVYKNELGEPITKPLSGIWVHPDDDFQRGSIKVEDFLFLIGSKFDGRESEVAGINFRNFYQKGGKVTRDGRSLQPLDTIPIDCLVDPNSDHPNESLPWFPRTSIDASCISQNL